MALNDKTIDKLHKQYVKLKADKPDSNAAVMPEGEDKNEKAAAFWQLLRPIIISLKSVIWLVGIFGKSGSKKKCIEIVNGAIAFFDQYFSGQDITE